MKKNYLKPEVENSDLLAVWNICSLSPGGGQYDDPSGGGYMPPPGGMPHRGTPIVG